MIEIKFEKNTKGNYDFELIQDGRALFGKECHINDNAVDKFTGETQEDTFKGYCKYLQDVVNAELDKNPDFKWNSFDDFKKFAGSKMVHAFMEVKADYIPQPKVN